jgi:putative acetyltransferase
MTVPETPDGTLTGTDRPVEILPFEPRYAADFRALNLEWLERYFRVEPVDVEVLSHPERILADGGHLLFARVGEAIVGTVALLRGPDRRYELSKMAVSPAWQGRGIGRALLQAMIAHYERLEARELYLESNRRLLPALALYVSVGFAHRPRPGGPSHYERADVYMTWLGSPAPAA